MKKMDEDSQVMSIICAVLLFRTSHQGVMILENVGGCCQTRVISDFFSEVLPLKAETGNERVARQVIQDRENFFVCLRGKSIHFVIKRGV